MTFMEEFWKHEGIALGFKLSDLAEMNKSHWSSLVTAAILEGQKLTH